MRVRLGAGATKERKKKGGEGRDRLVEKVDSGGGRVHGGQPLSRAFAERQGVLLEASVSLVMVNGLSWWLNKQSRKDKCKHGQERGEDALRLPSRDAFEDFWPFSLSVCRPFPRTSRETLILRKVSDRATR